MPGKKGARARDLGLERTDNDMEFTSWPQTQMINQKNYYTEFLKRDDQILALRLQNEENRNRMARVARDRDRALAQTGQNGVVPSDLDDMNGTMAGDESTANIDGAEMFGSKVIVIQPGSQNLRIGLSSDALPKTVPMVVARRKTSGVEVEEVVVEPKAKRRRMGEAAASDQPLTPVEEAFNENYAAMTVDLKGRLKRKGVRFVPNTREQAAAWNRKSLPDIIPEHNDTHRIEWTELPAQVSSAPETFTGLAALRIPDLSKPRYELSWPLKYGSFNERDYEDKNQLFRDIALIIEDAIKGQLGLTKQRDWSQYGCVFVIPDLYERNYVTIMVDMLFREFGFGRVCLIQESLSASFGAGTATCCVVDIGAQKTSICCVDEGMCVENSRIVLRYGGADVTETFVKMMLSSHFPYAELDLRRRHDWLVAEELKQKFCTLSYTELSNGARFFEFYLRIFGHDTRFYRFKSYDEVMLAPMAYFRPEVFDSSDKMRGRRKLIDRSYDLYDGSPNDPLSSAQAQLLATSSHNNGIAYNGVTVNGAETANSIHASTPSRQDGPRIIEPSNGLDEMARYVSAASPAQGDADTPQPARQMSPAEGERDIIPQMHPSMEMIRSAELRDRTLPCIPLDQAIALSIEHGARGDERKARDFFGGIIPIGGGSQIVGFNQFLEEELATSQQKFRKEIIVAPPPREIDPQVLVWKGASVFGKLQGTNDTWISGLEYDRLGSRVLAYKCLWNW